AALLRALGADRWRVALMLAAEFALTGAAGALLGMGLAVDTGLLLTRWWLDAAAPVPWLGLALTGAAITACCALAGVVACLGALRTPPLDALRSE
ncbi:MAG: ABC transporter permease, partial [Planctomycetes bacterium]|nr:ABC transporter permease [Planctomycetota bacterium]